MSLPKLTWHQEHQDNLSLGERAADVLRNSMGSWPFVFGFLGFMGLWATLHGIGVWTFDPFPYILLNLFLSMLAGLQGAILLIAAKRMDALSAAAAKQDYDTNIAAKLELDDVKEILANQDTMLSELRELLGERA